MALGVVTLCVTLVLCLVARPGGSPLPTPRYMAVAFDVSIIWHLIALMLLVVYGHACALAAKLARILPREVSDLGENDLTFSPVRPPRHTPSQSTLVPMGIPVPYQEPNNTDSAPRFVAAPSVYAI